MRIDLSLILGIIVALAMLLRPGDGRVVTTSCAAR